MKKVFILVGFLLLGTSAFAQQYNGNMKQSNFNNSYCNSNTQCVRVQQASNCNGKCVKYQNYGKKYHKTCKKNKF